MHARKVFQALVAAAGLLTMAAPPSHAATTAIVSFEGTITVTPSSTGLSQPIQFCFITTESSCGIQAAPSGAAIGGGIDPANSQAYDGLRGTGSYVEACAAVTGLAPTGSATVTAVPHSTTTFWSKALTLSFARTGTDVAISGDAIGRATYVPLQVPACGQPMQVLVAGTIEFTG